MARITSDYQDTSIEAVSEGLGVWDIRQFMGYSLQ